MPNSRKLSAARQAEIDSGEIPDKEYLYGENMDHTRKMNRLGLRTAYKSLDIPDDDMHIDASKRTHGIGVGGMLGLMGMAGLMGPAAIVAWNLLRPIEVESPTGKPAVSSPVDTEYDVLFFDKDGNPITIPQKTD